MLREQEVQLHMPLGSIDLVFSTHPPVRLERSQYRAPRDLREYTERYIAGEKIEGVQLSFADFLHRAPVSFKTLKFVDQTFVASGTNNSAARFRNDSHLEAVIRMQGMDMIYDKFVFPQAA